jgi:DNA-binding NarL/FixJ family response regulator
MRVVLVGTSDRRERLRARLPAGIDVAGEARTLAAARELPLAIDAYLIAAPAAAARLDDEEEEADLIEPLTPREREVLELVADGLPNRAIAVRLAVSEETIKFHLASIFGKLGATNRTDAVRRALRRGLVPL